MGVKKHMKNTANPIFEKAIEDNKASIYRICKVYAVSPIEPDDLFQEVVFHVWKALPSFEGKAKISSWIYRIALNVCMRYKSKLKNGSENLIKFDSIQFQIPASTPDDLIREKHDALYECIRSLNESDRSIAILVLDEMPYKEIASITGLTENHIAVKMKRMKNKLLKCINSKMI